MVQRLLIDYVRCINIHSRLQGFMIKMEYYFIYKSPSRLDSREIIENGTEPWNLTIRPHSHAWILTYRTRPFGKLSHSKSLVYRDLSWLHYHWHLDILIFFLLSACCSTTATKIAKKKKITEAQDVTEGTSKFNIRYPPDIGSVIF